MKSLAQMYNTIIGRPSTSAAQAAADAAEAAYAKEIISSPYVLKGQAGDPDITITIRAPRAIMESLLKGETEDNGYGGQQPKYFVNYATKQVERNYGA